MRNPILKALTLMAVAVILPAQSPSQSFTEGLLRIDRLARFRPVAKVGSFSSYDRTGGNDDGFSGRYSFLRKEGDGLVIAELRGPGALTRIWTPTPSSDPVEFFFNDEPAPRLRLPFIELFNGKTPPFVAPLTGAGAGGYYSYVPLEFTKSVKVVVRAPKFQFYQINYVLYEPGVAVRDFQPGDSFQLPPADLTGQTVRGRHVLSPGKPTTVFETKKPGRIVSLKLGPAQAFAGDDRAVVLRIYWDGSERPAVEVPAADFFGYSFGAPAARSLLVGAEEDWTYVRFPMPFNRSARIELVLERTAGPPLTVQSEVVFLDRPKEPGEGLFHAAWRRENPTTEGRPFTFLDVQGRGQVVGAILQAQGAETGQTLFFEGDDETTIDGETTVHGTGSEDFFNGGWYDLPGRWYDRLSLPFSGCLEYRKHLARTGGYRLLLADAYSFRRSLLLTIEHGGQGNRVLADYTGVTYYYLDRPEGAGPPLPKLAARAVHQPDTFTIIPGWQEPIYAFSLDHATITKATVRLNRREVRFLSLRQTGRPAIGGHFVAITVDVPVAGDYSIAAEFLAGPEAGIVQMLSQDQPLGEKIDSYAPERGLTGLQKLTDLHLAQGLNHLYFSLAGQNPKSSGLGFDLVRVAFAATHLTRSN